MKYRGPASPPGRCRRPCKRAECTIITESGARSSIVICVIYLHQKRLVNTRMRIAYTALLKFHLSAVASEKDVDSPTQVDLPYQTKDRGPGAEAQYGGCLRSAHDDRKIITITPVGLALALEKHARNGNTL